MRKAIDLDGFEALFRSRIDPWDYRTSPFEKHKRGLLLRACGPGRAGRGLELACAIGETSRPLLTRCLTLLATDGAPTALAEAGRRTDPAARIAYRQAILPRDLPRGPFDLIVVSEIAYYLGARDLRALGEGLVRALAPGGRIVVLHHVVRFDDAVQIPALAHSRLCRDLARSCIVTRRERHGRFEIASLRRRRCSERPGTAKGPNGSRRTHFSRALIEK